MFLGQTAVFSHLGFWLMRPITAFDYRKFFKDSELLNTILPNNKLFPRDPFGRSHNNEISPGS